MAPHSRTAQRAGVASLDPIWAELRQEAEEATRNEPALGGFIYATILSQERLEDAVRDPCTSIRCAGYPCSGRQSRADRAANNVGCLDEPRRCYVFENILCLA